MDFCRRFVYVYWADTCCLLMFTFHGWLSAPAWKTSQKPHEGKSVFCLLGRILHTFSLYCLFWLPNSSVYWLQQQRKGLLGEGSAGRVQLEREPTNRVYVTDGTFLWDPNCRISLILDCCKINRLQLSGVSIWFIGLEQINV